MWVYLCQRMYRYMCGSACTCSYVCASAPVLGGLEQSMLLALVHARASRARPSSAPACERLLLRWSAALGEAASDGGTTRPSSSPRTPEAARRRPGRTTTPPTASGLRCAARRSRRRAKTSRCHTSSLGTQARCLGAVWSAGALTGTLDAQNVSSAAYPCGSSGSPDFVFCWLHSPAEATRRIRPNSGQHCAEFGPTLIEFGPNLPDSGPMLVDIGWSMSGQI